MVRAPANRLLFKVVPLARATGTLRCLERFTRLLLIVPYEETPNVSEVTLMLGCRLITKSPFVIRKSRMQPRAPHNLVDWTNSLGSRLF